MDGETEIEELSELETNLEFIKNHPDEHVENVIKHLVRVIECKETRAFNQYVDCMYQQAAYWTFNQAIFINAAS